MKLLILADIHGRLNHLSVIESVVADCDGIIIAGDITDFGGAEQAGFVISRFLVYGKPILAVPGNCDLSGVEGELEKCNGNLHGSHIDSGGLQFVGMGGSVSGKEGEDVFRGLLERGVSGLSATAT